MNCVKIIRIQLYLLIWFHTAETLTDLLTDLGQNVTINCDLNVTEVSWLLLKLPHPPVMILRSFVSGAALYYNDRFIQKYLVQTNNKLFINNVTLDELGVYYCLKIDTMDKRFNNGTRLHISEPPPQSQNCKAVNPSKNPTKCLIFTIILGLINVVLIVLVIGLLKFLVYERNGSGKSLKNFEDIDIQALLYLEQLPESTQTQYVVVNLPAAHIKI